MEPVVIGKTLNRSHFKNEDFVLWGIHEEAGILEIMFNNFKKKNAFGGDTQDRIIKLLDIANKDDRVKVVLIHGGPFFSAGNDLSALVNGMQDRETGIKNAQKGVLGTMV